jgi:hypothetical protein
MPPKASAAGSNDFLDLHYDAVVDVDDVGDRDLPNL